MQLTDIILELKILWKRYHLYFSSAFGSSHGLSSSKPEPATIVRSRAIWSQSHNNSLAPLIYGLAHMASGSKPSCGNTTLDAVDLDTVDLLITIYQLLWMSSNGSSRPLGEHSNSVSELFCRFENVPNDFFCKYFRVRACYFSCFCYILFIGLLRRTLGCWNKTMTKVFVLLSQA